MGGLRSLLGPLCAQGRSWAYVGGLGTNVVDLGQLLGVDGRFWAALGASIGGLGCTWAALGAYVGDLGPLLGLYWRSWPALGAAVCDPGPLLEPMLAVLGRSWALCWRSWAALGPYVGGLGPLLGPKFAVLGRDQGEKRPKPGKVAQTRARAGSARGRAPRSRHKRHRPPQAIFQLI